MARARKRTSESVEDSKLLRERRGRPRSRGRAHRRLARLEVGVNAPSGRVGRSSSNCELFAMPSTHRTAIV